MPPGPDCPLCPRLVAYRAENRRKNPAGHNAPVPSFGNLGARLLVVGQAPGVNGANRTGRPFTGDYAGHLLYATLRKFGFADGDYAERADDGLVLHDCRITNAVRCAPPQHILQPSDKQSCNKFLAAEIAAMPDLRVILAVGGVAHAMTLRALGIKTSAHEFAHGKPHTPTPGLMLIDSYHVSRLNTNTRRLTAEMFEAVVGTIKDFLENQRDQAENLEVGRAR